MAEPPASAPPPPDPPTAGPPPPEPGPEPAASPTEPAPGGLFAIARRVDEAIFSVEKALVTVALLVMTATVGLDIVFRSFAAPQSAVGPAIAAGLAFVAGVFLYVTIHGQRGRSWSWPPALVAGAVALGAGVGFVYLVTRLPSRWVCAILLLIGCVGWGTVALRRGRWGGAFLASVIALLGLWACMKLRKDYIWSQELSLILLAWVAFIGGSMATREQKHIFVEALAKVVPKRLAPWSCAAGFAATTAFCAFVVVLATVHVFGEHGDFYSGETRPATGIPAYLITLAPLVAFGLMMLRFGATTIDHVLAPRVPQKKELL